MARHPEIIDAHRRPEGDLEEDGEGGGPFEEALHGRGQVEVEAAEIDRRHGHQQGAGAPRQRDGEVVELRRRPFRDHSQAADGEPLEQQEDQQDEGTARPSAASQSSSRSPSRVVVSSQRMRREG